MLFDFFRVVARDGEGLLDDDLVVLDETFLVRSDDARRIVGRGVFERAPHSPELLGAGIQVFNSLEKLVPRRRFLVERLEHPPRG